MRHLIYVLIITNIFIGCENRSSNNISMNFFKISANDESENELENDSNTIILSEYIILNKDFQHILDVLIEEYRRCESIENGYHFTISIQKATILEATEKKGLKIGYDTENVNDTNIAKSLYISRSYFKGYVSKGYGFFYYKESLFVLIGIQLEDLFRITKKTHSFSFRDEPVLIFDPPRWSFCYWNNSFYFIDKSPCGG